MTAKPAIALSAKLPAIHVVAGELPRLADDGEAALISADVPIFRRGALLVRPIVDEVEAAHSHRTHITRFARIDAAYLRDQLGRHAQWKKFLKSKEVWIPTDPPHEVGLTIIARSGEWKFSPVVGVISCPTLRPDGSVLMKPGYDPATRLFLGAGVHIEALRSAPTKSDAQAALKFLSELLIDFPFTNSAGRAVALSGLITPVVRGAFHVAPMHVSRAPTPGSGKSFLWDVAAGIALGTRMPVLSAGRDAAELEKRIHAALLGGGACFSLDNVNGSLGGDALCQAIERPTIDVRPLGGSDLVRIESRATIFASGNNLSIAGDMVRRALVCSLDAAMERPELRAFNGNPLAKVLSSRSRYVAACLTITRAYLLAGRPDRLSPLASFEGWSDCVRSALVWLGEADPVTTMEQAREDDPVLQNLSAVIGAFEDLGAISKETGVTAAEAIQQSIGREDLREALSAVAGVRGGLIDARRLGHWLRRHKGRVVGRWRIDGQADDHGHSVKWFLARCG